jgi:hypothetical protein
MANAWRFRTEFGGDEVWVYSLSEPAARRNEIPGPAALAIPVDMPENIEEAFGYTNGSTHTPEAVLADADSGEIVKIFPNE